MGHSSRISKRGELSEIADRLSLLADELRVGAEISFAETPAQSDERTRYTYLQLAKQTYADRRKRDGILGDAQLLGEPAWDILLDLYIAQEQGHEVSVSSACIGSAAPPTTGLRWLGVLQDVGLVERINDPSDQRRVLVRLTAIGLEKMEAYFAAVASTNSQAGGDNPTDSSISTQNADVLSGGFRLS